MATSPKQYHEDLSYEPSISSEESYEYKKLTSQPGVYRGTAQTDSTRAGSQRSSHRKTNFLKVVVIGDSNVGKTSLIENFQYKQVKEVQKPTIGADFMKKIVTLRNGNQVPLQVWDTAGQERFQSLSNTFYRGTDCCIIVFDLTCFKSYKRLKTWRKNFVDSQGYDQFDESMVPIIIVGNKTDLTPSSREVEVEQVLTEWIDTGLANNYIETSAYTSQNVEECFNIVAEEAREYQISTQDDMNNRQDLHSDIMQQLVSLQKQPIIAYSRKSANSDGTTSYSNNSDLDRAMIIRSTMGSSDDGSIMSDESPPGYQHNRKFKLKSKKHKQEEAQSYTSAACCYFV